MKPWRDVLEQHVQHWTGRCRARGYKWRPKLVYHFTDVQNAANVLTNGCIWSRSEALARDLMRNENAVTDIIDDTPPEHLDFVRLYFRPRTPTLYRNEGIRHPREVYRGAHCPVPVFFCFDLVEVVAQDEVLFSNGSMARPDVRFGDSVELFQSIPFEHVYHDGPFPAGADKAQLIFHRHAEVLVPRRLDLTQVAGVACRSSAERTTLLHLVDEDTRRRWRNKIHAVGDPLYYREWIYIDNVFSVGDSMYLDFNVPRQTREHEIHVSIHELNTGRRREYHGSAELGPQLRFDVPGAHRCAVEIRVNGALAFAGELAFLDDAPF